MSQRVLHVSEVSIGGVSTLLRAFMTEQAKRGDEPHLLAPTGHGLTVGDYHPWEVHRKRPAGFPHAVAQLNETCREIRPDVVHLHSFFAGLLGRMPLSRLRPHAAIVYQPHGWNYDAATSRPSREVLERWERYAGRRTDVVATNCLDEKREGEQHGVSAAGSVVGVPICTDTFAPASAEQRMATRRELGLDGRRVALCLASLCWQKGQDRLVTAWEQSPPDDAVLVLVGGAEGPYLRRQSKDHLRQLAPRQWGRTIRAVGHQADVRPWLRSADLLVQPSRYEALGVAVAESLACGVPVVTCMVNGAREVILDGSEPTAGAVVPQGDMRGLLAACASRFDEPGLLEHESRGARQRALRLFAVSAVMDRLDRTYQHACLVARGLSSSRRRPSCG